MVPNVLIPWETCLRNEKNVPEPSGLVQPHHHSADAQQKQHPSIRQKDMCSEVAFVVGFYQKPSSQFITGKPSSVHTA